jgi:hypothetical protein
MSSPGPLLIDRTLWAMLYAGVWRMRGISMLLEGRVLAVFACMYVVSLEQRVKYRKYRKY